MRKGLLNRNNQINGAINTVIGKIQIKWSLFQSKMRKRIHKTIKNNVLNIVGYETSIVSRKDFIHPIVTPTNKRYTIHST